ncbi:host attachment protein [Hydrogenophilus islandicus]
MKKTWVVVANASMAKIFQACNAKGELELITTLNHPESRLRNQDLVTDRQMEHHHGGAATPHDGERVAPKEVEAQRFAQEIAAYLKEGRTRHAFERLIVVATPHFKGLLLAEMDSTTAKLVEKTIDKDYTQESERTLSERLADAIRYVA